MLDDGVFIIKDGDKYKVSYLKTKDIKELKKYGRKTDNLIEAMELADIILEEIIEIGKCPVNGIMVIGTNGVETNEN